MGQAMGVVVLSSVATGIGSISSMGGPGIVIGTVTALMGWYFWACLIYIIGTRILPEPQTKSNLKELLRTIGFSNAPGLIRVFGIIPGIINPVFVVASIWTLVAMVIAVRQALDYKSTLRAVAVCVIGLAIQTILLGFLFYSMTGGTAQI